MIYRPSPYRWVILSLLSCSYLLVYVHRMCPAVLADDLVRDFSSTGAMIGVMASAYFYPYALMQPPAGIIADRLGPRKLITICMFVATAGAVWFSLAASVSSAFWARMLVGLGSSAVLIPTYKALTTWFPANQYLLGTCLVISIAGLGGFVAGSPLAWLSGLIGWRNSLLAVAGLTFLNGFLVWTLVRDTPRQMGLPPVEPDPENGGTEGSRLSVTDTLRLVAGKPDFWLLALWFFLNGGAMFSFSGLWAGPYYMQVYGMDRTAAGGAINMFAFGMISGPLIFAWINGKVRSGNAILGGDKAALALLMVWLLLRNGVMRVPEIYALNFLFGLLCAGAVGVCFTAVKELFPIKIAGSVTGFLYIFPMAGTALYQPLAGLILDRSGAVGTSLSAGDFTPLFLFYLASFVLAGMAGFGFKKERKRKTADLVEAVQERCWPSRHSCRSPAMTSVTPGVSAADQVQAVSEADLLCPQPPFDIHGKRCHRDVG